jgi:tetratricopeptide (TPR) repeat protein
MKKQQNFIDTVGKRYFSNTSQLQRIIIGLAVVLVVAVVSFGSYYYYDRYYRPQPKEAEAAVEKAMQAVRNDPKSTAARLKLSETYMLNHRWDDAILQANQVLKVEPENQSALLVIGVSSVNNGKPADAVDPLTKFVNARKDESMPGLDRQLQSAAYYLGDSYLQLGKPKEAVTPLEQAVNWSTTDADAMYKLGVAYVGVKEYEKAVNMFHGATTFVPDFLEAYSEMSKAYAALNKPALVDYANGMMAYSKKDYAAARDLLLKSAQAKADFAPTFAGLGRTYEALNDLPNAKGAYEAALKIDMNNFTASNGLERIEALLKK